MTAERTADTEDARGDAPGVGPYLAVFEPGSSRVVPLPERGVLVVGRGHSAGLRLADAGVSREHARIVVEDGRATVEDLGSHNGTLVGGARITAPRALADGDVVTLGGSALVLHDVRGATAPAGPPPVARELRAGERTIVIADAVSSQLYALVERLAPSALPVLVHGETGAGKELVALALHHLSPRRAGPFVALNCAAIAEGLVESELFGHERGAFTGALTSKPGMLEVASGGTLFLDEVADLPATTQAKLLRALDQRRVQRVGDVRERPIDVRVVAATHRDLGPEVSAGRFRSDLYFRLSGATVWVAPLRDRPHELRVLATRFLDDACRRLGRAPLALDDGAWHALAAHPWPGNVRELGHVMEHLAALAQGATVHAAEVVARLAPGPGTAGARPLDEEVRDVEIARMRAALDAAGGNQRKAAAALGVPLRTFATKLARYGLQKKQQR